MIEHGTLRLVVEPGAVMTAEKHTLSGYWEKELRDTETV